MNKTFDRYSSVAFALIGAFFVAESRNISTSAYGSEVGPNMFPLGLGILLILLSLRLFWESSKKGSASASAAESTVSMQYGRFAIMLLATLLYVLLLEPLGYVITTFFFLLVGFQVMGNKSILSSLLVALGFSAGVYYLYVHVLKGTLPGFPAWLGL